MSGLPIEDSPKDREGADAVPDRRRGSNSGRPPWMPRGKRIVECRLLRSERQKKFHPSRYRQS